MEKRKRPPLPLDASPQEKYDNLILTIFEEWQEFSGDLVSFYLTETILDHFTRSQARLHYKNKIGLISSRFRPEVFDSLGREKAIDYLGFNTLGELLLVLNAIIENGLLEKPRDYKGTGAFYDLKLGEVDHVIPRWLKITYQGLNYCHSLLSSGKNSTRCFVAMKYSADMAPYYDEGIAKAVEENGFRPIRVDREHADNEQTINDFIIASIKQSRFCVADLTHQSHGAYFEAGYALGRGLKVIYTCHEKDWDNLHFDVKSFQVLKYASVEELRKGLSLKIQAFVMD
jgi:hypothetical protein